MSLAHLKGNLRSLIAGREGMGYRPAVILSFSVDICSSFILWEHISLLGLP